MSLGAYRSFSASDLRKRQTLTKATPSAMTQRILARIPKRKEGMSLLYVTHEAFFTGLITPSSIKELRDLRLEEGKQASSPHLAHSLTG